MLPGAAAGRVESGVATLPGQTGQHLLLDLLPVAVLSLGGQQAAHRLSGADQTVNSVSFSINAFSGSETLRK